MYAEMIFNSIPDLWLGMNISGLLTGIVRNSSARPSPSHLLQDVNGLSWDATIIRLLVSSPEDMDLMSTTQVCEKWKFRYL